MHNAIRRIDRKAPLMSATHLLENKEFTSSVRNRLQLDSPSSSRSNTTLPTSARYAAITLLDFELPVGVARIPSGKYVFRV
jgi:hypothetical protein